MASEEAFLNITSKLFYMLIHFKITPSQSGDLSQNVFHSVISS